MQLTPIGDKGYHYRRKKTGNVSKGLWQNATFSHRKKYTGW